MKRTAHQRKAKIAIPRNEQSGMEVKAEIAMVAGGRFSRD